MVFLANERLDFLKGDVSFLGLEGFRLEFPSDEPIGYVNVILYIFGRGIGLKEVADADVEVIHLSVTPELQSARLLCSWDFPGKHTGVAIYFSRGSS